MLAMIAAMKEEIAGLKRRVVIESALHENGYHAFQGKYRKRDILLVQSGMGKKKAEKATADIFERYPVNAVVSFGFAGALTAAAQVGDIVLCTGLASDYKAPESYHSDSTMISRASLIADKDIRCYSGKCLTVGKVVTGPETKLALGKTYHANVVDMESYWVARLAGGKQVPFLTVRAISDTAQHWLPPFDRLRGADGMVSQRKLWLYVLARPTQLKRLLRVRWNARRARKSLTDFLDQFVERI